MPSQSRSALTGQSKAPWLDHYPACIPHHLEYPDDPVWWFLEVSGTYHAERVACRYYEQQLTYAELLHQARQAAGMFARMGVQPGDRVGILLPNVPEFLVAAYGAWMAGGVVVPLSPLLVAEEISDVLQTTQCKVVVALDLLAPLVAYSPACPEHLLLVTIKDHLPAWKRIGYTFARFKRVGIPTLTHAMHVYSFDDELAKSDDKFHAIRMAQDAPAYLLSTGGTTGKPKAVMLSHRNLVANAWQLFHWAGSRVGKDSFLSVLPFFHSYGLSTCATAGIASAATLVMHQRFDPHVVLQLMEQQRPTIFHAVPAMLSVLNGILREKKYNLRSLQFCILGGAPLDPAVGEEFARHTGATVVEGYGLSEASPVTHVGPLDGTARPGTIGLPLPDTEARIVDAETGLITLPPGEVGELVIRGPQVMLGYWNNPEETAKTIRDGWLFTGDLATCDADGFFKIVDRKKDLIITSGFNVYPTDVEFVLRRFPGISDVAVVGVPDAQRGEIVKVMVVMNKGVKFDRKAFDRFTHEHLAKHKQPRAVEVLEDLPRNFLGKVLRRKLRDGSHGGKADLAPDGTGVEETDQSAGDAGTAGAEAAGQQTGGRDEMTPNGKGLAINVKNRIAIDLARSRNGNGTGAANGNSKGHPGKE